MRGLLEEAHAHLEQATTCLEAAVDALKQVRDSGVDDQRRPTVGRVDDLANLADDLASRVSNLVREARP